MNLSPEVILICIIAAAVGLLLVRFTKRIGAYVLIAASLVLAIDGATGLLVQSAANYKTAEAAATLAKTARTANTGQTIMMILLFVALIVACLATLVSLVFGGYLGLRWKLSQIQRLPRPERRSRRLPRRRHDTDPSEVIIVTEDSAPLPVDLAAWGFGCDDDTGF